MHIDVDVLHSKALLQTMHIDVDVLHSKALLALTRIALDAQTAPQHKTLLALTGSITIPQRQALLARTRSNATL